MIRLEQSMLNIMGHQGRLTLLYHALVTHIVSNRQSPAGPRDSSTFSLAHNCVPQHKVLFSGVVHLEQSLLNISERARLFPLLELHFK